MTVMDVLIRGADVLAEVVWQAGRGDAQQVLDGLAATLSQAGGLATTFLGPLALLFGMIGLLVTTVVLFMRSSLLYLVAAFAPIVWSSSVSPVMRGAGRRLVHVTVALVLAKPAITVTLVVGVKLLANAGTTAPQASSDGAAALGTLVTGFACFAIAGLSPWVVYRLLPSVEGAAVSSGIVGGWGRAGMTAVQAGLMVKSLGASAAASAATRSLPSQFATAGSAPAAAAGTGSSSGPVGGSVPGGAAGDRREPRPHRRPVAAVAGRRRPGRPCRAKPDRCRSPPTVTRMRRCRRDGHGDVGPLPVRRLGPVGGAARVVGAPVGPAGRRGRVADPVPGRPAAA